VRALALLILFALAALCAAGCAPRAGSGVGLWTAMESELPALRQVVADYEARTGVRVNLLKVPFAQLRNKFLVAAPADLGPDLLIGPQDWVGVLATAGLLDPLGQEDLSAREREGFVPVALEGVTFQSELYALPLFTECVALIRNPDLVPRAPASMEELIEVARQVSDPAIPRYGFYYDLQDLYFSWSFFSGYGAYVFGQKDGRVDPLDLGLDKPAAVQAASFLADLRLKHRLIPLSATTDLARTNFLEGQAAMILNGPWMLKDLRGQQKVRWVIEPLPPLAGGGQPRPFVGVQAVMLSKRARLRPQALALMKHLASRESLVRLARAAGRIPAGRQALEDMAGDPDIAAFARVAALGVPMPNHPAMGAVWGPMAGALEVISKGQRPAQAELTDVTARIRAKIRQMME
jgi:arabinogalactan oligomer/maltooligosaccharide transport system substrate-binding protein